MMKFFLLLLVTVLASQHATLARNPGLKLKLSQAGFNYAAKIAIEKLSADVRTKRIPDYSGSSGVLSYGISNTRITSFTSPGSAVRTEAGSGITFGLSNIGVSVHGDWHYHLKWLIFSLRDSGSFDVSISGVTLRVSFGMGVDNNGRPTIRTKSCSCYVGNVDVKFHGGASWFYNIFSCVVENKISDRIKSQLCDSIQTVINEKASRTLQNAKVRAPINDIVTLDYSLVAAPVFGPNYLQFLHRGEFFWTQGNKGTPELPPAIADLPGTPKMVTFCMSDYVSNSLGNVMFKYGDYLLKYSLTEDDLPEHVRYLFNAAKPLKTGIGQSADVAQLLMYATEPPTLNTDTNGIGGRLKGRMELKSSIPTGEMTTIMAIYVKIDLTLTAKLVNNKIISRVQQFRLSISDDTTGSEGGLIEQLINVVVNYFIVPKLNEVGQNGYPLPALDDVKYINPELHLLKGAVCFSTDVSYTP